MHLTSRISAPVDLFSSFALGNKRPSLSFYTVSTRLRLLTIFALDNGIHHCLYTFSSLSSQQAIKCKQPWMYSFGYFVTCR